jgi:hypothetical protein
MREIYVYGDYALNTQCELERFDSVDRARQFVDGYTKYGDLGGYDTIEVITFLASGEAVTHHRVDAEDPGLSWDWEDDNALMDEF